jgi:hypothetical protein
MSILFASTICNLHFINKPLYYHITSNIRHILRFPIEELRCILNLTSAYLSIFSPKTQIQKQDVSYIRSNMVYYKIFQI